MRSGRFSRFSFSSSVLAAVALIALTQPTTPLRAASASDADSRLLNIVALSSRRIAMAQPVANWKWHNNHPIEDKPREHQLLDQLLGQAPAFGVDARYAELFFTDQMSASKQYQNALFARWQAARAPAAPDPATLQTARRSLGGISNQMLTALAQTQGIRNAEDCPARLGAALAQWQETVTLDHDASAALSSALTHVCTSGGVGTLS